MNVQCHDAITQLVANADHRDNFMNGFMNFTISFNPLFYSLEYYHARFVWGQAIGIHTNLSKIFNYAL